MFVILPITDVHAVAARGDAGGIFGGDARRSPDGARATTVTPEPAGPPTTLPEPAGPPTTPPTSGTISDVSVAAHPATVTLAPGQSTEAVVVITNSADRPVAVESVTLTPTPGLTASELAVESPIAGSSTSQGSFTLSADRKFEAGSVAVLIAVAMDRAGPPLTAGSPTVDRRTISTSIAVAPSGSVPSLKLTVVSAPSELTDSQEGAIVLTVNNSSPFLVTNVGVSGVDGGDIEFLQRVCVGVDQVRDVGDDGARSCAETGRATISALPAGATEVIALTLRADGDVHVGTTKIAVVAAGKYVGPFNDSGGETYPVSSEATVDVKLTVFGLGVLSDIGFTTLFLVPGLLAILIVAMLLRWVFPRTSTADIDLKKAPLLVIGAIVGAIVYLAVWWLSGVDLARDGLNTTWVLGLATFGVGAGVAVWAIYAVAYLVFVHLRQFRPADSPLMVITRLSRRGQALPAFTLYDSGYLIGSNRGGASVYSPRILYSFKAAADPAWRRSWRAALGDADTLNKLAHDASKVSLRFSNDGAIAILSSPAGAKAGTAAPLLREAVT